MRALFDRRALDSELDLEMRDHIVRETRANVARGMSQAEARRVALAAFGGVQHFKEETRDARGAHWFDAVRQDASHAARSLLKSPGFTATVVITLALGVGANAAVYSVLQRIYLREPAGIAKGSELRRLYQRLPVKANMNGGDHEIFLPYFDYTEFAALGDAMRGHAELAVYSSTDSVAVKQDDNAWPAREVFVSAEYFSTLGVAPARGRFFAPGEAAVETDPGVAVISYALWDRAFAKDPGVIGRTVQINKRPFVIIGVSADGFTGLDLNRAEIFLPLGAMIKRPDNHGNPWFKSRMAWYFTMVARVPAGDDRQLLAIGTPINRRVNSDMRGQSPVGSKPDTLSSMVTGPIIATLGPDDKPKEYAIGLRVAGVAAIVLLIACANIANLLLVRANQRRHEVAIRLALGVSRARLATQFLTEGLMLAAAGGIAAIVVAAWGGTALRHLILPATRFATPAVDLPVLGFTLAVAIITGLAAAVAPMVEGSRVDIVKSLKPGTRGAGRARSRTRSTLLAAQTALSLVLLAGAGLFVRSLQRIHSTPFGYAADELAFATLQFDDDAGMNPHRAERIAAFPRAAQRVATAPGVVGVALAYIAPLQGAIWTSVWKPDIDSEMPAPQYNAVSPAFFAVTGVRILAGRSLTSDDRSGAGGALVVNATMAKKFWPGESPVGKCVIIGKRTAGCSTVVGLAEDTPAMQLLETKPHAQYFVPMRAVVDSESVAPSAIIVRTRDGEWRAADEIVRAELHASAPAATIKYDAMMNYLERELRPFRLGAKLFTAFGLLALLVAGVGVYGVIAYSFSQRTHELGVRSALGATGADTYRLVLGEALRLMAIGVAAGVALSLALGKLVASLLYATSAKDPVVIVGAAVLLGLAGVAASLLPAWRASRSDPMEALRAE
jgi:putative ABC transport system permease protein